jgi:hypothetical protein
LGSDPKEVLSPQNSLLAVPNCTWTSRPITASYLPGAGITNKNTPGGTKVMDEIKKAAITGSLVLKNNSD